MHHRKSQIFWFVGGLMLLMIGTTLWLADAQTSEAQCGSQASSCKNCHEVQGKDPVNNDGTGWHESHAFGDFCYICHGGNQQATDETAAHEGMVAPLADTKAACQQCHPGDLEKRAQVYADALGIDLASYSADTTASGTVASSTTSSGAASSTTNSSGTSTASSSLPTGITFNTNISLDDPNVVDYAERYDEIVLGKRPTNWGNIALVIMIELVIVGGSAFVVVNETRRRSLQGATQKVEGGYPQDVVEMLPAIAGLKVQTRRALKKLLANPQIEKVLGLIDAVAANDKPEGDA